MDTIIQSVFESLQYLFVAYIVYEIYKCSKSYSFSEGPKPILWRGLLWCLGVSLVFSIMLGTASCIEYDYTGLGQCIEYANDSYSVSLIERIAEFVRIFVLGYLPVVIGAFGRKSGSGSARSDLSNTPM